MVEHFATITEEALNDLRKRLGVIINETQPYIEEATRDNIRHWAHGIGDTNPLWLDEAYAGKTGWGGIIASPTILYAFSKIVSGYVGGLPGVHAMYSGTDWRWYLPIRLNDRIKPRSYLKDLVEKNTQFAGRAIQQIYHTSFHNQKNELIAEADSWCFRTERRAARDRAKYHSEGVSLKKYSKKDLDEIFHAYENEVIRGADKRYWDDVSVGEELNRIVKGPMTPTTVIVFDQGWGGLYLKAHKLAYQQYKAHPALGIPNALGIPEPPERVHWENELARDVGVPAAYDYGPERVSWLGNLVTNWMGDDGFLKKLNVQVRRHNILGDTTWCYGKVVRKFVDGDDHIIECSVQAVNQNGEISAIGEASVVLPGRK